MIGRQGRVINQGQFYRVLAKPYKANVLCTQSQHCCPFTSWSKRKTARVQQAEVVTMTVCPWRCGVSTSGSNHTSLVTGLKLWTYSCWTAGLCIHLGRWHHIVCADNEWALPVVLRPGPHSLLTLAANPCEEYGIAFSMMGMPLLSEKMLLVDFPHLKTYDLTQSSIWAS